MNINLKSAFEWSVNASKILLKNSWRAIPGIIGVTGMAATSVIVKKISQNTGIDPNASWAIPLVIGATSATYMTATLWPLPQKAYSSIRSHLHI